MTAPSEPPRCARIIAGAKDFPEQLCGYLKKEHSKWVRLAGYPPHRFFTTASRSEEGGDVREYKTLRVEVSVYDELMEWSHANLGYRDTVSIAIHELIRGWRKKP